MRAIISIYKTTANGPPVLVKAMIAALCYIYFQDIQKKAYCELTGKELEQVWNSIKSSKLAEGTKQNCLVLLRLLHTYATASGYTSVTLADNGADHFTAPLSQEPEKNSGESEYPFGPETKARRRIGVEDARGFVNILLRISKTMEPISLAYFYFYLAYGPASPWVSYGLI